MAARQAMIVGGRRVGRKNRIPLVPKLSSSPVECEVQITTTRYDGLILNEIQQDLSLVQSQEMNTIEIPGKHSYYEHYIPTQKVKRIMDNKNMRRHHRVHQPGFDTQRRPIKN